MSGSGSLFGPFGSLLVYFFPVLMTQFVCSTSFSLDLLCMSLGTETRDKIFISLRLDFLRISLAPVPPDH